MSRAIQHLQWTRKKSVTTQVSDSSPPAAARVFCCGLCSRRLQSPQQKTLANHRRVPIYRARVVRSPELVFVHPTWFDALPQTPRMCWEPYLGDRYPHPLWF